MKATAQACSNIALVKYWGKGDETLRLPVNSSAAVGLDQLLTQTTVDFSPDYTEDLIEIDGDTFDQDEKDRIVEHLDRVRSMANIRDKARVVTKNNFPKAAGAASSASGFAALSLAAAAAAGLQLSNQELSVLARKGSGSACRSIPGGFSVWHKGNDDNSSFAEPIPMPAAWDMRILLVFTNHDGKKEVGSSDGMKRAATSPYYIEAVSEAEQNITRLTAAAAAGDWDEFGRVIEDECFRLHMLCMTSVPHILYWQAETVAIFQRLLALRAEGVKGFFTVDAGPHVHVICQAKDQVRLQEELAKLPGVKMVVNSGVGGPATLLEKDLF